MKRWNMATQSDVEAPRVDDFIAEVIALCKQRGFVISHEDTHGAFVIMPIIDDKDAAEDDKDAEEYFDWLREASVNIPKGA